MLLRFTSNRPNLIFFVEIDTTSRFTNFIHDVKEKFFSVTKHVMVSSNSYFMNRFNRIHVATLRFELKIPAYETSVFPTILNRHSFFLLT